MSEITSILKEKRVFKPRADFSKNARVPSFAAYEKIYKESVKNPEKFWAGSSQRTAALVEAVEQNFGMESAVREMVSRRKNQCVVQLP